MSSVACQGCSVPLHNRVGVWSLDPYLAGGFAIVFVTFILAVALLGISLWQLRPARFGGAGGYQFYGLRVALISFIISLFFNWLYLAIPNAIEVDRGYLIFGLFPQFFLSVSETILVNTLTRMSLQPLVQARGYHKARRVGLGLSISFGFVSFMNWVSDAVITGIEINITTEGRFGLEYPSGFELAVAIGASLALALIGLTIVWGLTFMGLAIHALRKSRHVMENTYRVVPKLMIAASIVWILRAALSVVVNSFTLYDGMVGASYAYLDISPIISGLIIDIGLLIVFILLLLAFRPHLLPLYQDGALAQSTNGRSSRAEEHREVQYAAADGQPLQGQYQTPVAVATVYSHEKPSNEYAGYNGQRQSSDPGIEVAHQPQNYV